MPLYHFQSDEGFIKPVAEATFKETKLKERPDLQRLLREHIEVLDKNLMVLAEEFGAWEDSDRRIDLLALDKDANLVVIELKRDDSAHMELQAIRYAAMVSAMTWDKAVSAHEKYLTKRGYIDEAEEAEARIQAFLGWDSPHEAEFAQRVRIVLAASAFSKELTTTVLWLNGQNGFDIRCFRMVPYLFEGAVLVDVQQIIPLPEAADFQTKLREKTALVAAEKKDSRDLTKYNVKVGEILHEGLPKRQAVLEVVLHLWKGGATPDDIAKHCVRRYPWLVLDGNLDSEEFQAAAAIKFESEGFALDRIIRYFHESDDLIHWQGKTYALINQWGGPRFTKTLDNLKKAYSGQFEYWPAE